VTERLQCGLASRCPGCPAIELAVAEQLAGKRARVERAVTRFEATQSLEVAPCPAIGARDHYRTRTKWVVDGEGRIGLYARGTHEVVDLERCPVLRPSIARVVAALRALRVETPLLASRGLRGIDLRETLGDGASEAACVLVSLTYARGAVPTRGELDEVERAVLAGVGADGGPPLGVSLSVAEHDGSARTLGTYRIDRARARLDRIGVGPPFLAAHGAFVQAHREVAAALHDRIASRVAAMPRPAGGRRRRVLELFAGSGALALRLASEGADVTAVERFLPAIELARASAERAHIDDRFRAVALDAAEALVPEGGLDVVIVNPPRRGVSPSVRDALARSQPALLVYVACDPETLARDLSDLARLGLRARVAEPFDMMPQTHEVETLVFLEPAEPTSPRVVAQGDRWLAVDKAPPGPRAPHPGHWRSLLEGGRRLPGLSRATPVHRLDAGTSGVCLFAASPEDVPPLQRALSAAEKTYVALVRGVPREKGVIRRALREEGRMFEATTRYRRRALVGGHGLVDARPAEGRTHQIRRHLASIGHPVVGDARHGHEPTNRHLEETCALDRTFLHCKRIDIEIDGVRHLLESPLPADLTLVLDRLGPR